MRVAIVTESFLPQVNGVTNSVRHVVEGLHRRGHEVLVVAPGVGPTTYDGAPVLRVRSLALPGYRSFPLGLPDRSVAQALRFFRPDVVHLASPIALGWTGLRAAQRLGVPVVAVYQTDVAGFSRQYGVRVEAALERWVGRLHRQADRTLVPSTASRDQLAGLEVEDLHLWRRGVSLDLFDPRHRSRAGGPLRIGYVGRLAAEKQVHRLVELDDLPGTELVVVGDGPMRTELQARLPDARFTGMLGGEDLAAAYADLDVFVHTGEAETFCQTVQEAQASGVAVVVPARGGPRDLVEHGVTGLWHEPDRPETLRDGARRLVDDAALRDRLADAGRRAVAGRSWDAVVGDLVEHHRATIEEHRRRADTDSSPTPHPGAAGTTRGLGGLGA